MSIHLHSVAPSIAPTPAVRSGQQSASARTVADFHSLLETSRATTAATAKTPAVSIPHPKPVGVVPRTTSPTTTTPTTAPATTAPATTTPAAAAPTPNSVAVPPAPIYGLPDANGNPTVTGQTQSYSLPSPDGLTWDQYWQEIENLNIAAVTNSSTTNPADVSTRTAVWETAENAYVTDPYSAHNMSPEQLAQYNAASTTRT